MPTGEPAEYGDAILLQHLVQHGLHAAVGELCATVGKFAQDDTLAAVEHTVHLEDAHLTVDVMHRLSHFFYKQDEVVPLGGIGL